MNPWAWDIICEGINCDIKHECRRHTYYLLALAGNKLVGNACIRKCVQRISVIKPDDMTCQPAPRWWEQQ